jgi:hypothetical protein
MGRAIQPIRRIYANGRFPTAASLL